MYYIYWHNHLLRKYNKYEDFENGKKFFEGFLLHSKLSYKIIY